MSKIGIGVTTPDHASWQVRLSKVSNSRSIVFRENKGNTTIAKDKNALIKQLYDDGCSSIFIFDDDTFPIKQGWEQFFISASERTGCQHFILGNDKELRMMDFDGELQYFQKGTGCMLFLTRKCIETVGYINNRYGKYGYEHAVYSNRIHRAGLTPSWYVSVEGWEEYVYSYDLDKEGAAKHGFVKQETMTQDEKLGYIAQNQSEFKREMSSPQLYYDYEQQSPLQHMNKKKVLYYSPVPTDTTAFWRTTAVFPFIQSDEFDLIDISATTNFTWVTFIGASILIMQRPFVKDHCSIIAMAKDCGLRICLDYDDDIFAIDQNNPTFQLYQSQQEHMKTCIAMADELWVTTPAIKESYKHFNTHVIPNAWNDHIWPVNEKRPFKFNKKAMYRGGASHQADMMESANKIISVINGNTDWQFLIMGDRYTYIEINTGDNHGIVNGMPIMQYFKYLFYENPCIMFFPLCTTKFNEAKSSISFLEASFAGAAFFGNKKLPEFDLPCILDIDEMEEQIHDGRLLESKNKASWEYIKENLLLSSINKLRIDRILANL